MLEDDAKKKRTKMKSQYLCYIVNCFFIVKLTSVDKINNRATFNTIFLISPNKLRLIIIKIVRSQNQCNFKYKFIVDLFDSHDINMRSTFITIYATIEFLSKCYTLIGVTMNRLTICHTI